MMIAYTFSRGDLTISMLKVENFYSTLVLHKREGSTRVNPTIHL